MDLEVLANFGWREALIAIIAMLVLYVFVVFLRLRRLQHKKVGSKVPDPFVARAAVAAYAEVNETTSEGPLDPLTASGAPASPVLLAEPSEAAFPWNEPPPEIPAQKLIESLEREIEQLRSEMRSLYAEVQELRDERQRENAQSDVTQNVSPLYSDAMQLALQGQSAVSISQHCGISRAEAELVVALVRNREN